MTYAQNVERLKVNIWDAVCRAREDGITSMSKANLRQMTSFAGCYFPSANVADRCFDEALYLTDVKGFIHASD